MKLIDYWFDAAIPVMTSKTFIKFALNSSLMFFNVSRITVQRTQAEVLPGLLVRQQREAEFPAAFLSMRHLPVEGVPAFHSQNPAAKRGGDLCRRLAS